MHTVSPFAVVWMVAFSPLHSSPLADASTTLVSPVERVQAFAADEPDKPAKRYPELEGLSLGFSPSDIVSIDEKYLGEGFVILKDASGQARYELPLRLTPGAATKSYLTSKYIFIVYDVAGITGYGRRPCVLAAFRPSGKVDGNISPSEIDTFLKRDTYSKPEEALYNLVSQLPETFLPKIIQKNIFAKYSAISGKRQSGEYLSDSDAGKDVDNLKTYVCDTLNSALIASKNLLPEDKYPQFTFERPLVQTRSALKRATLSEGQPLTKSALDAIRLLNSQALHARMGGYTRNSSYQSGSLDLEPWALMIDGTRQKTDGSVMRTVTGAKVPPYPTPDGICSVAVFRDGSKGEYTVLADGSLQYEPEIKSYPVLTLHP